MEQLLEIIQQQDLKKLLAKAVGYAILAGSALVKAPQIQKVVRAKSVHGITRASTDFDLVAAIAQVAYFLPLGYPFSTWGENVFLLAQNAIMFGLHAKYSKRPFKSLALAAAAYLAAGYLLYKRALPDIELPTAACRSLGLPSCALTASDVAGALPMLLGLVARVPQIVANARQGHTGELALATYLLNVLGALARVGTTLSELDDRLALCSALLAFVLNGAIFGQICVSGLRSSVPVPKLGKVD